MLAFQATKVCSSLARVVVASTRGPSCRVCQKDVCGLLRFRATTTGIINNNNNTARYNSTGKAPKSGKEDSSESSVSSSRTTEKISDDDSKLDAAAMMESIYVHPLSQIVLIHLQDHWHDWVAEKQIDTLKLHRDGTFVLEFPDRTARIWTFYDPTDKKHWLSVRKHHMQHRFLLQDNLLPAWHGNNKRQSLPERIQKSVEDLVQVVNEMDEKM